jgi:hypothetical protein
MMRPGHDQSTPFGLSPNPAGQSCRFVLVEVPAIGHLFDTFWCELRLDKIPPAYHPAGDGI